MSERPFPPYQERISCDVPPEWAEMLATKAAAAGQPVETYLRHLVISTLSGREAHHLSAQERWSAEHAPV